MPNNSGNPCRISAGGWGSDPVFQDRDGFDQSIVEFFGRHLHQEVAVAGHVDQGWVRSFPEH